MVLIIAVSDLVLWDSHPLSLGATPQQVWIDGIPQIASPFVSAKSEDRQHSPEAPNFDEEAREALEYDGLPPIGPRSSTQSVVIFTNVTGILRRAGEELQESVVTQSGQGVVVVDSGRIVCSGTALACSMATGSADHQVVDLEGGWISLGAITYGSPLGLEEIAGEASTSDGFAYDPLSSDAPRVAGGSGTIVRAVDGLQYGTRNAW